MMDGLNEGRDCPAQGRRLGVACRVISAILVMCVMTTLGKAQQIEYLVSITKPQTQTVTVQYTVRGVKGDSLEVALPVWRPGRYQVLDPAGSIRSMTARAGNGRPLAIVKIEKSAWVIRTAAPEDDVVTVSYEVYANSLGDRTRHVDDTHAFFSPAAVFVYSPALRDLPLSVRIEAPRDWKVATGLDAAAGDPRVLKAPNYDVLVDSPIEVGLHEGFEFDAAGTPHQVVMWTGRASAPPGFDKDRLAKELATIVRYQRSIFLGEREPFPYSRYVFILHCYPGGRGGTEHLNSTVCQLSPSRFTTPEGWRSFYGLLSHEYFHTYNVKQLRPAGLKPYDYQRENYTELLWVAEGTTSYYDDLTLVRVGLTPAEEYLKTLGEAIDAYRRRPGARVQSLEDSSFDAWIKFNKPDADSVNSTVSFYDVGSHVNMLIDFELRRVSRDRVNLDMVMADLYRRFPLSGPGFTTDDFINACQRLAVDSGAAADMRSFILKAVRTTEPLEFDSALGLAGLEIVNDAKKEEGSELLKQRAFIGVNVETKDGAAAVTSVLSDGPAFAAGVMAGDQVVAINGYRVRSQAEVDSVLKHVKPGEVVRLSLFRHDVLRQLDFKADGRPDGKWVVRRVKSPTAEQKAMYQSWLHQPWDKAEPGGKEAK